MKTKKIAITIPEDVLETLDETCAHKKISRSRMISDILREKIMDERNQRIRKAYDSVFADSTVCQEQLRAVGRDIENQ